MVLQRIPYWSHVVRFGHMAIQEIAMICGKLPSWSPGVDDDDLWKANDINLQFWIVHTTYFWENLV
jgi:hypothetical protein